LIYLFVDLFIYLFFDLTLSSCNRNHVKLPDGNTDCYLLFIAYC